MTFAQKIVKRLSPFMREHGFRRAGSCFYSIRNGIAFCVELSHPSCIIYVPYYLIPLYIPTSYRYFTYGNRLRGHPQSSIPSMGSGSSEKQQEEWIKTFKQEMQSIVFPFFEKVSQPGELAEYVSSINCVPDPFIFCSEIELNRLLLFTYSYLNKKEEFASQMQKMQKSILECDFFAPRILDDFSGEIRKLASLLDATDQQHEVFFNKIKEQTQLSCFRIKAEDVLQSGQGDGLREP